MLKKFKLYLQISFLSYLFSSVTLLAHTDTHIKEFLDEDWTYIVEHFNREETLHKFSRDGLTQISIYLQQGSITYKSRISDNCIYSDDKELGLKKFLTDLTIIKPIPAVFARILEILGPFREDNIFINNYRRQFATPTSIVAVTAPESQHQTLTLPAPLIKALSNNPAFVAAVTQMALLLPNSETL